MAEQTHLQPSEVHEVLARHVLTDGMKLVLDLRHSRGSRLVDAHTGERYLDMYTFFASAPLGVNPPGIADDPTFMAELGEIAVNKPANPDMYSTAYAEFVETFRPRARRSRAPPSVLHRRRRLGRRKCPQGRLRLEEPEERGRRARPESGQPDHASDACLPRPQRLHPVADQHRTPQDGPIPEVQLAAGSTCLR